MSKFQSISPDDNGRHPAAKAEGDSNPALSRFGAGERLLPDGITIDLIQLVGRPHIERMIQHAESVEAK